MANQLEEIKKLYAKGKIYTIPKQPKEGQPKLELEITPITLDDIGVLDMGEDKSLKEIAKNTKLLFSKSLQLSEEEVEKISFEYMEEILAAIMDANNFKEADIQKTGIKDFVSQKKEQLAAQKEKDAAKSNR